MTTENEQITPADAAIVSSGTGTKGPEERDLPASLKEEMDLCLQILREVLGEFDENLLAKFDEVREHALKASDERFSGILTDTNPDQDDLQKVVDIIDKTDVHEAQLLARAFTTYFHLANLCEENYRVSVLHSRENAVDDTQADDDGDAPGRGFYRKLHDVDFFVFRHRCGFARGAEYNKSAHVVFNLKIDEAPERIVIDARIGKRGNKRGSAAFEN